MYVYGMRLRGFSIGCQPSGVVEWKDSNKSQSGYWSIIKYDRKLTDEELSKYSLDFIEEV
jgi:hypothetical protein